MAAAASSCGLPVTPGLGVVKNVSGSDMPQKTRPMPMPAANSIENHDIRPNSGLSSSFPSLMSPNRLTPIHTAKTTKAATRMM